MVFIHLLPFQKLIVGQLLFEIIHRQEIIILAITFALGKGFWQIFVAGGLTMWVDIARVVRGEVLSLKEKEYVEATRALGFSTFRTIFRHILPNIVGAVVVIAASNFASAILLEAGLSFLGIGVQPPMPSWGMMVKENYGYILLDSAYLALSARRGNHDNRAGIHDAGRGSARRPRHQEKLKTKRLQIIFGR